MKGLSSLLKMFSRHKDDSDPFRRHRDPLRERRDFSRYPHHEKAFYYTHGGACYETRTVNLSNKGVKFASEQEIPGDVTGDMLMVFNGAPLRLPVKIIWTQRESEYYEYGAQFVSRSPGLNMLKGQFNSLMQQRCPSSGTACMETRH